MTPAKTNATANKGVSAREIAHRKLAREAAAESIVLLSNNGALPIDPGPVALFGSGAATTIKGGTGSGEVNERYSVTIEQGLIDAGFTITTGAYLREYEALLQAERAAFYKGFTKKILFGGSHAVINIMSNPFRYPSGRLITDADAEGGEAGACVYVVARQAGECADRKLDKDEYNLTRTEIDNLKFASKKYEKLIVVINAGGSMDISPLDEIGPDAIIFFCQQGMEGGNAFADILTGAATPSGCLSSTWPAKYEDWAGAMEYSYLKGHTDFEEYKEGIYVGYRYFDSFGVAPRYEMGHGLSYTDFLIETQNVAGNGADIAVNVKVTNTGAAYSGKKIVQLYVSPPGGKLEREYQSLMGFAKTGVLAPGESQELALGFSLPDIAAYDEDTASYILEQGDYVVRIGGSSAKTSVAAVVSLDATVVVEECVNVCKPAQRPAEIAPSKPIARALPDGARRIAVSASAIPCKRHSYAPPEAPKSEEIESIMSKLAVSDMISLVCGAGVMSSDPVFRVQGVAAYTTSRLYGLGVPNAALADGPAGLRLQNVSVRGKNGKIKPVGGSMGLADMLPWAIKKFLFGNPDKGTLLYQYTSAFPVGTAQAQTWNTDLVGRIGDAIGAEMAEFGVTYWLAPGMNIHRNPLCGRNFEYYSEDPFLTGKMAAAVTRGVQSHEGCYVTIKHYATNNQEDNRNKSDSRVSERALREIYLKGFRMAVEEGGAKAVMTGYNKLNGTYASTSYDLCTTLLRNEWGFDGVVMTDWFSTGKGLGDNGATIKAGNDLIMPAGKWYMKMLDEALSSGALKEEELRLCCARVLKSVMGGRTGMSCRW